MVDISNLVVRRAAFEDRLGVDLRFISVFLEKVADKPSLTVRGEIHLKAGKVLSSDTRVVVAAHDSVGRIVGTSQCDFSRVDFYIQDIFEIPVELSAPDIAKVAIYPMVKGSSEEVAAFARPVLTSEVRPQPSRTGGLAFGEEIKLLTEEFGYKTVLTPNNEEHGVAIVAEKGDRRVAVMTKFHTAGNVGSQEVQKLLAGMKVYKATEALLITTTQLSTKATELCNDFKVVYYDHDRLLKFCQDHQLCLPSWCCLAGTSKDATARLDHALSIGRESTNDLSFPKDPHMSRCHFKLKWERLALWIEDCNSSNGTKVDGHRITQKTRLRYGSKISAGEQQWTICEQSAETAARKAILI